MALPITDTFTGADGTNLTAYNAAWVANSGTMKLEANGVRPGSTGVAPIHLYHRSDETWGNNQYAQCSVSEITGGVYCGLAVRVHASAVTGYLAYWDASNLYVDKWVAGTQTTLGASPYTGPTVGVTVKLEVVGTTIKVYYNAAQQVSLTDASIASGFGGVCGYDDSVDSVNDNWESGNTASAGGFLNRNYWWEHC